jgi:hypothetical protein
MRERIVRGLARYFAGLDRKALDEIFGGRDGGRHCGVLTVVVCNKDVNTMVVR